MTSRSRDLEVGTLSLALGSMKIGVDPKSVSMYLVPPARASIATERQSAG